MYADCWKRKMIDIFIIVHRTDLIDMFEASRKFYKSFNNFKYLLLGKQHKDVISTNNVIVAVNLKNNLEEYNSNLCAYSGWYAIAKNNLSSNEYCLLLEYDVDLSEDFLIKLNNNILDNEFVGFIKLKSNDRLCMYEYKNMSNEDFYWMATTNIFVKTSTLNEYVDWFNTVYCDQKNNKYASHIVERTVTEFARKFNKNYGFATDVLTHYQLDTHHTQGFNDKFESLINKVVN